MVEALWSNAPHRSHAPHLQQAALVDRDVWWSVECVVEILECNSLRHATLHLPPNLHCPFKMLKKFSLFYI